IHTFEQYNRGNHRHIAAERHELREIASLLIGALARSCHANQRATENLGELLKDLRHSNRPDDLRAVRTKLEKCLDSADAHAEHPWPEPAAAHDLFPADSGRFAPPKGDQSGDLTTGLSGRQAAVSYLGEVAASKSNYYAVPFVLERLTTVYARFGHKAGDEY